MPPFKDITGQKFGRLTAIKKMDYKKYGKTVWLCECDCGELTEVTVNDLLSGNTKSCGCIKAENNRKTIKKATKKSVETNARGYYFNTVACQLNSTISSNNTTGVRGVDRNQGKYRARIVFKQHCYNLGRFETLEEAAKVRKEAEEQIWGDFIEWYKAIKKGGKKL